MKKHTKIICTLGPTTRNVNTLSKMIKEGMDVARLNFSHGDIEHWDNELEYLYKARKKTGKQIPILADTKGPEIRTGLIKDHEKNPDAYILLKKGQKITFICSDKDALEKLCTHNTIYLTYDNLPNDIDKGQKILLDDGNIVTKVISKKSNKLIANVLTDGKLKSRKGVNVPGGKIKIPAITNKDKEDLLYAIDKDVDYVALSFVRSGKHVKEARTFLNKHGGKNIWIISKIENQEGVDNMDEIIKLSDGIMVARGDLGVEIPFSKVPLNQHKMILKSLKSKKIVITATEMLDSMIKHPTPTRAEINDIYNTVRQSSTCVMLSAETANGKYPVEAVKAMTETIIEAESAFDYKKRFGNVDLEYQNSLTTAVCHGVVDTAYNINSKVIVAYSSSGHTAKSISAFRPKIPIIVASPNKKVIRQSHILWGVTPILQKKAKNIDTLFKEAGDIALRSKLAKKGDIIVITAGTPVGVAGSTNTMKVVTIGKA